VRTFATQPLENGQPTERFTTEVRRSTNTRAEFASAPMYVRRLYKKRLFASLALTLDGTAFSTIAGLRAEFTFASLDIGRRSFKRLIAILAGNDHHNLRCWLHWISAATGAEAQLSRATLAAINNIA